MRLTEQALATLNALIEARFAQASEQDFQGKRLTREVRAELMGVSVRTSDRILKQEPVDRSSLVTAFSSLRAPWDERYLEQAQPVQTIEQAPSSLKRRPSPLVIVSMAALAIALAVGGALSVRPRDWLPEFMAEMDLATKRYHRAEFKEARRHLDQAAEIARPHRQADALAWVQRLEAEIYAAEGNKVKALERIQLAVAYLKDLEVPDQYFGALELSANYKASLGKLDEARADYLECLAYGRRAQDRYVVATSCRGLGEICIQRTSYEEAIQWFEKGMEALGPDFEVETKLDLKARKGLALAHLKKFPEALKVLRETLEYWEKKGHVRWIATSHFRLGTAHGLKGDRVAADMHFTQARAGFVSVGDERGVHRSDKALGLDREN